MYARFYTSTLKISLTVVYTPTNESTEEAKETFMEQLQETIKGIPIMTYCLLLEISLKRLAVASKATKVLRGSMV